MLAAGTLINRAGGFVTAFLALILAIRNISAPGIAVALAAAAIFTIAGAWLSGALISRLGSRRVIAGSMIGSAAFTAALIPVSPYPLTVGIACLIALCNRAYVPAATTMIGRLSAPGQRLPMFSFFQLSYNVGAAIGSAAAGYLLTHSLTVLLLIDAATSACFALAALRLPADAPPVPHGTPAGDGHAPDTLRRDRRYLLFCAAALLVALAYTQHTGPLPLTFRRHHESLVLLGTLFSANAIAVILFQLPLSYLTRRLPVRVPLMTGAVLIGGGYALLAAGFSVPLLIASVALWTAGEIVYAPAAPTAAMLMSKSRTHGSYQGALDVARSAGQAFGPSLGVFAYSASASAPWWGSGVLGVAAACLFLAAARPRGGRDAGRESREPAAERAA